jgi:hypothetical protein
MNKLNNNNNKIKIKTVLNLCIYQMFHKHFKKKSVICRMLICLFFLFTNCYVTASSNDNKDIISDSHDVLLPNLFDKHLLDNHVNVNIFNQNASARTAKPEISTQPSDIYSYYFSQSNNIHKKQENRVKIRSNHQQFNYAGAQRKKKLSSSFSFSSFDSQYDVYESLSTYDEVKCTNKLCQKGVFKWHESKRKNLYVGGIFPMVGSWPGGQSCLPSAIMALNEVNLNDSILPGYRLNLDWYNSEVSFNYNKFHSDKNIGRTINHSLFFKV